MTHPIPLSVLDERFAFVGMSGSGKTYGAGTCVEKLLEAKARVIIVDPLGVWWGLRLAPKGVAASGFNIPIFGGAHGDLALTEHAGALIGETVAGMAESSIIDLSQIGTKAGERRFMLAFLTALYRGVNGTPVHLVIDEADMFAPQRLLDKDGDAAKLLGMMETIVRRGRVKGFTPWFITQRPAVLAKDVLSQADGMVAFKLTASQDRDAIGSWIEGQADKQDGKAILASLPKLERGTGVIWIPSRGVLKTAQFPAKGTFDSSRAPKRGEAVQATKLKPLDLGRLKDRLATVDAETKANDPKALKAELAELRRQIASKSNGVDRDTVKIAEAAAYIRGKTDGYADAIKGISAEAGATIKALENARSAASQIEHWSQQVPPAASARPVAPARTAAPARTPAPARAPAAPADGLTSPQRRIMTSLAFWKSIGHEAPTRAQVAAIAGYRPGSGNFNNIIGGLGTMGQTVVPSPGRLALNIEFEGLTSAAAASMLWSVLKGPQKRLVEAARESHGDLSRDELATGSGYKAGSGNFNNIVGSLTTMEILQRSGPGHIVLSDWAREVLG